MHADSVAQTAVSSLDELARSTQYDELTGAPTRALMLDRLENAIAMAQRRATRVGVIFLDLDCFKQINDSLGHAVGDRVLQLATRRLEAAVRESDSVSRHGGDEFVVLLAEMAKASDAAAVAQKILESLAVPAQVGAHTLSLSGSLGISVYPEDGADPMTLIDCADAAMYRAKKAGPGRYAFCSEIVERDSVDAGLRAPAEALPRRCRQAPRLGPRRARGAPARAARGQQAPRRRRPDRAEAAGQRRGRAPSADQLRRDGGARAAQSAVGDPDGGGDAEAPAGRRRRARRASTTSSSARPRTWRA